jgi:hypothetical protein
MITASVGVGKDHDAYKAGREACVQALAGISPAHKVQLLVVFGSTTYDQEKMIAGISETVPDALLIGCSSAGEISSEGFSTEKSVVVMAFTSDQMRFFTANGGSLAQDPHKAGMDCANQLQYDSHGYVTSAMMFVDVLSGVGDRTLAGVFDKLGPQFPVYGGAASDDLLFFETFQYYGKSAQKGTIVGAGFSGDYHAVGVSGHGFLPIGIERTVTRSEGATLFELDGEPAMNIYKEYFGEEHLSELHEGLLPSLAVSYPLGVFSPDSTEVVLRNPVFVDQKGAMTFTSEIPVGAEIRLMISDIERGLETTEAVAKEVLRKLGGRPPKAAIIINSVARRKMLGLHADAEIETIQRILGRDVPMIGMYSYAQIDKQPDNLSPFHNGALTIWALAE